MARRRSCASWWKGNHENSILYCATKSTALRGKRCETHSATRKRKRSKRKLHMVIPNFCCTCEMTEAELLHKLPTAVPAQVTGGSLGCGNGRRASAGS